VTWPAKVGKVVPGAAARVGYLPQQFDLLGTMRALDVVRYAAWCNGLAGRELDSAARQALKLVDLEGDSHRRCRQLSGGQRQRLGLAASVAHRPSFLFLDEPTAGLDPEQRILFRRYLVRATEAGVGVLIATHLLEDVRGIASLIVVLADGRVAFTGAPDALSDLGARLDQNELDQSELESAIELGYRAALSRAVNES
jgi:ABC-2 type transport system ATP-binding protein